MSAAGSALMVHQAGLHARPAVKLTKCAKGFAARVEMALDPAGPWVDAKSIVKVMGFRAPHGATLHFRAEGADAEAAVAALAALVEGDFAEAGA